VGKAPGQSDRQAVINELLVDAGRSGRAVVRLKGGDPFLFGRGGEEAEALRAAGVDFVVVPGVTSAFAAPAAAGIPVTHRTVSTSVTVATGHAAGTAAADDEWAALARTPGTLVVLMGMATRPALVAALLRAGRPPDTPSAVVHWGTTDRQRVVRTTLAGLPDVDLPSPSVIVVGPVADLDLVAGRDVPDPT
jgi:uroporphyrin-III C-methyltransferase